MNKDSLRKLFKNEWHLPYAEKIRRIIHSFTLTEKVIFTFFLVIFFVSGISLLWQVNKAFQIAVPDYGGTLTEGIIGAPRFVNPVLAVSDIDRDLTTLVYSGLLKVDATGDLVPDLAESYTISKDGLLYTFVLKDNIFFHDGTPVTADDVVFTIEKTQDTALKSPRRPNWTGVRVEKINDKTITFRLTEPYSPFIQNTTLGILPKHIWSSATSDEFPFSKYNIQPVGSGPYKVSSIAYTSSGLPSEYHLTSFNKYVLGTPYITSLVIKSYQNEKDIVDAYKGGDIESMHGISPKELQDLSIKQEEILRAPLPRVFGVFFNQNVAPVFVNKEVRQALDMITNKQEIIDTILGGYGQPIDEPIPPKSIDAENMPVFDADTQIEKAKALLIANGWKQNASGIFEKKTNKNTVTLAFSISTGDAPELKETATLLQKQWQKIGARVEVKIFEIGDLNQNIIRPRKYDSLLFGEIIGRDLDLYPFWHSSERNDPGLNIALYTNLKVDGIIENIRATSDTDTQNTLYTSFTKEIKNDIPAVFTYSPYFIYIVPTKVHNIKLGELSTSAERFSDISTWYIETNNVWKIFTK
ncbi:MAG: ABC transporter substrate-binding protein [Patescibacteria group bacterium]